MTADMSPELGPTLASGNDQLSAQDSLKDQSRPRYLTQDEILASATRDFGIDPKQGYLGGIQAVSLESFVRERVTGVRMNGVDVLSIDFDHSERKLDPYIEKFIKSDRTRVVVAEYFYPELERNISRSPLRSVARMQTESGRHAYRLEFAQRIADAAKVAEKPVAVADIANKPSYMALREAFRVSLVGAAQVSSLVNTELALLGIIPGFAWQMFVHAQHKLDRGIFNRDQISRFDKLILDFEQARRLYLARGIEQLTEEYPPTEDKPNPQIVVVYPKAHGIRMADALVDPHRSLDRAKSIVYKSFGPKLNFAVRTYAWKDSLQRLRDSGYKWGQFAPVEEGDAISHDSDLAASQEFKPDWMRVSNRKI